MSDLLVLVETLETKMNAFILDSKKLDNKSAARRARKLSMEITRDLKEYRKDSAK